MGGGKNCWLGINGKKFGPMTEQDIRNLYSEKKITKNILFFRTGMKQWVPLSKSDVIAPLANDEIPPSFEDGVLPPLPKETAISMMDDERILKNIDKFSQTKECKCLLCGYKGQMGVVRNKISLFLALVLAVIFGIVVYVIFSAVFFGISDYIGLNYNSMLITTFSILILLSVAQFSIQFVRELTRKKVLFCPNCEKEIVEK